MGCEHRRSAIVLGMGLTLCITAGCTREAVDESVREARETTREVATEVKQGANEAKAELKEHFPEFREEAKQGLVKAREAVKEGVETAGEVVKEGVDEAREAWNTRDTEVAEYRRFRRGSCPGGAAALGLAREAHDLQDRFLHVLRERSSARFARHERVVAVLEPLHADAAGQRVGGDLFASAERITRSLHDQTRRA